MSNWSGFGLSSLKKPIAWNCWKSDDFWERILVDFNQFMPGPQSDTAKLSTGYVSYFSIHLCLNCFSKTILSLSQMQVSFIQMLCWTWNELGVILKLNIQFELSFSWNLTHFFAQLNKRKIIRPKNWSSLQMLISLTTKKRLASNFDLSNQSITHSSWNNFLILTSPNLLPHWNWLSLFH